MFCAGNPRVRAPGMVFFVHMILPDSRTGLGRSVGEPSIVTESGCEPLTHAPVG
jgi:Xaa-Pro dipeptidase